jgi:hypothetical protein
MRVSLEFRSVVVDARLSRNKRAASSREPHQFGPNVGKIGGNFAGLLTFI